MYKVKYLIGKCCLIQSVDSIKLASEISRQSKNASVTTNILLEVNAGEEQKGGFSISELQNSYEQIKKMDNIVVKGLMTVLPKDEIKENKVKFCLQLRNIYDIMKKEDSNFSVLSMGMSEDYPIAIECGSNMVRIGTKIFGERNYKEKT